MKGSESHDHGPGHNEESTGDPQSHEKHGVERGDGPSAAECVGLFDESPLVGRIRSRQGELDRVASWDACLRGVSMLPNKDSLEELFFCSRFFGNASVADVWAGREGQRMKSALRSRHHEHYQLETQFSGEVGV